MGFKTFSVKLTKVRLDGGKRTSIQWPSWWDEVYQSVDVIAYEDAQKQIEEAICICPESLWVGAIAPKADPNIEELTEEEADSRITKHRPSGVKIVDESELIRVVIKLARGGQLSQDEADMLDPDAPTETGLVKKSPKKTREIATAKGWV